MILYFFPLSNFGVDPGETRLKGLKGDLRGTGGVGGGQSKGEGPRSLLLLLMADLDGPP